MRSRAQGVWAHALRMIRVREQAVKECMWKNRRCEVSYLP